jgi:hypothetical protein
MKSTMMLFLSSIGKSRLRRLFGHQLRSRRQLVHLQKSPGDFCAWFLPAAQLRLLVDGAARAIMVLRSTAKEQLKERP